MDNKKGEVIDHYTQAVAELLLVAKNRSGLSFTALAQTTGLGRATVVRVLNGERNVTLNYLKLICDALSLDIGEVIENAEHALERDKRATDCPPEQDPDLDEVEWDATATETPGSVRSHHQSDYELVSHPYTDETGELMDE